MKELIECPFCGKPVKIKKSPLWHGDHGYKGEYKFFVCCEHCGGTKNYNHNYSTSAKEEQKVEEAVISQWNERAHRKLTKEEKQFFFNAFFHDLKKVEYDTISDFIEIVENLEVKKDFNLLKKLIGLEIVRNKE